MMFVSPIVFPRPGRCCVAGLAVLALLLHCPTFVQAAPIRIMPIGDSITAGYTDNPNWNVTFEFGYRSGLYTLLTGEDYDFQFVGGSPEPWDGRYGTPKTVGSPDLRDPAIDQDYHRGYGGWGVSDLQNHIVDWLLADDPDVVLLMAGINDISYRGNTDPIAQKNNLNNLVGAIVATKPDTHVIVAQITPYSSYTGSIVKYNTYIRDTLVPTYAAQGKNVTTVDQYSNFLNGGVIDSSLYANGYNHPNATGYGRMAQTWLEGIQALGIITPTPSNYNPGRSVLANGDFETPVYADDTHNVGVDGAGWVFTGPDGVSPGAGSGIDRNWDYGDCVSNHAAVQGAQTGFLQGAGAAYGATVEIKQDLKGLAIGQRYRLTFRAKAIDGLDGGNPFRVSVGGDDLEFAGQSLITPATNGEIFVSVPFTATDSVMPLRFRDEGGVSSQKVSWIDDVTLAVEATPGSNLVANGGFETPGLSDPEHVIAPSGAGWSFTAPSAYYGAGIDRGDPYGASNCTPFEGEQMACLMGNPSGVTRLEQEVSGFTVGAGYVVSFEAKAIDGYGGVNPFRVSLGYDDLTFGDGAILTPGTNYELFVSSPITATDETLTLRFYDLGDAHYTQVTWIDDVKIVLNPALPGDANGDGIVDEHDAAVLSNHWGDSGARWSDGDFTGDGRVNVADAAILAANWQATADWRTLARETSAAPEPTLAPLLLAASLTLTTRRRRSKT